MSFIAIALSTAGTLTVLGVWLLHVTAGPPRDPAHKRPIVFPLIGLGLAIAGIVWSIGEEGAVVPIAIAAPSLVMAPLLLLRR